jgi:hypothetical protein
LGHRYQQVRQARQVLAQQVRRTMTMTMTMKMKMKMKMMTMMTMKMRKTLAEMPTPWFSSPHGLPRWNRQQLDVFLLVL